MLTELVKNWPVTGELSVLTPTTWDIAGKYILKRVGTEAGARNNVRFSNVLRAHDVPVSQLLPTRDGGEYIATPEGCYLLMEKLGGSHITDIFNRDYAAIAYQTGIIVARIHRALRTITDEPVKSTPFDLELRGWIREALAGSELLKPEEWEEPIETLCGLYPQLPKQEIHRDIHYGNLLFEGNVLTGVLDFDLGKQDARLFDLAYFLLGQLLGQRDLGAIEERWLVFARKFLEGYGMIAELEESEIESLPLMMQCIEYLFIAFWYEQENKDAMEETLKILRFIERVM